MWRGAALSSCQNAEARRTTASSSINSRASPRRASRPRARSGLRTGKALSPSVTNKSSSALPTRIPNGGSWSYFVCPRCGGRKKKLWLIDDAPRCLSCCWSLGVRHRSAYGFGRSERLRERDGYVDRVQDRRLRGRRRRLTGTMRRSMIVCRLAQLAHQQKAKDGSDKALQFMRSYQPRKAAIVAIPDLKRLWKAQSTEALEQALDQAQRAILDALQSDDIRKRMTAASLMLRTRAARQRGLDLRHP